MIFFLFFCKILSDFNGDLAPVTVTLASATNFGGAAVQPFCRLNGGFTATTPVVQLNTFNTQGAAAAGAALCSTLTARSLNNADDVSCNVATVSGTTTVVALVTARDGTIYECRATLVNNNVCPVKSNGGGGNSDGTDTDDDRKRQPERAQFEPCANYRTFVDCTLNCDQNVLGDCPCLWDNPNDPTGFPNDMNEPCADGKICCYNPPCSTWTNSDDCTFGSGGYVNPTNDPDLPPNSEANCEYIFPGTIDAACVCRSPLVAVELVAPAYPPFDCFCPFGVNNATTPSQCINPADPTAAQLQQIRRYNQRVGTIAAQATKATFKRQCPKGRTRVQCRNRRDNLGALVAKYTRSLRNQRIAFDVSWGKDRDGKPFADITYLVNDGKKLRAIADSAFTAAELEELDIQDAELAESSAAFATLSAAAVLVVAANQL